MPTHKHDPALLQAIGSRLKKAREASGLSQAELAGIVRIEPVTLSRYETGARGASVTTLSLAAQALGTSLADLVDVDAPEPDPAEGADLARALGLLRLLGERDRTVALGALDGLVQAARSSGSS